MAVPVSWQIDQTRDQLRAGVELQAAFGQPRLRKDEGVRQLRERFAQHRRSGSP